MENQKYDVYYIKNMFCQRCINTVESIFSEANFQIEKVRLGEVITYPKVEDDSYEILKSQLEDLGFEIVQHKEIVLTEKVKSEIIKVVHLSDDIPRINIAEHLRGTLEVPYKKLSIAFKSQVNMTIEKYFILQKIERAKALLQYDELSVKEIAYKLGYSSLQHPVDS